MHADVHELPVKEKIEATCKSMCNYKMCASYLDMSHPMIVEIRRGCELLTADEALMRFFAAVDALMRVQRARG